MYAHSKIKQGQTRCVSKKLPESSSFWTFASGQVVRILSSPQACVQNAIAVAFMSKQKVVQKH